MKSYLVGSNGVHANNEFMVEQEIILGRNPKMAHIILPESDVSVSGTHCKVQKENDRIVLIDLNSTNGTYLKSGEKLSPNVPYTLRNGDSFYLGYPKNMFTLKEIPEESRHKAVSKIASAAVKSREPVERVQEPQVIIKRSGSGAAGVIGVILVLVIMAVAAFGVYTYVSEQNKSSFDRGIDFLNDLF